MKENQIRVFCRLDRTDPDDEQRVMSCNVLLLVEDREVLLEGTWDKNGLAPNRRDDFGWALLQGVWWAKKLGLPVVVVDDEGVETRYKRPAMALRETPP